MFKTVMKVGLNSFYRGSTGISSQMSDLQSLSRNLSETIFTDWAKSWKQWGGLTTFVAGCLDQPHSPVGGFLGCWGFLQPWKQHHDVSYFEKAVFYDKDCWECLRKWMIIITWIQHRWDALSSSPAGLLFFEPWKIILQGSSSKAAPRQSNHEK